MPGAVAGMARQTRPDLDAGAFQQLTEAELFGWSGQAEKGQGAGFV
jgi:hypothetical protein